MSIAKEVPATRPLVHVVDDDEALRNAAAWMLEGAGYEVPTYAAATEFLDVLDTSRPCCVVTDVRMSGMSGLELQNVLVERAPEIPVILITAHGDLRMAVEAVKIGAFDFIEKPFDNADLRRAVAKARDQAIDNIEARRLSNEARAALSNLTNPEREVFGLVATGHRNKALAHQLDITVKTIEVHRSRVMEKLGVTTPAEVIGIFRAAEKR